MYAVRSVLCACLCAWMSLGCVCGSATLGTGNPNGREDGGESSDGIGVAPFTPEQACQALAFQASLSLRPVDIIMIIDNSSSMSEEIQAIQNNINLNFAQILNESGIDYRVIVVSKHGSVDNRFVCISAPLSGTDCDPVPPEPVFGARFFHYDVRVNSTDSLAALISSYDTPDSLNPVGWGSWVRPEALKTFIEVSDDTSVIGADDFEAALFAKQPAGMFGDTNERNYIFHSIIGIVANATSDYVWLPTDPAKAITCATARNPGVVYQQLSIRSGGLRFPVCATASYDVVFQAAARVAIQSARVSCDFTPPPPPSGSRYDEAYVVYAPGDGSPPEYFFAVEPPATCSATGFLRDVGGDRITLCAEACAKVRGDAAAELTVLYSCATDTAL